MSDWDELNDYSWWSPSLSDGGEVLVEGAAGTWMSPSPEFAATFPQLTELLRLARMTTVRMKDKLYHLYGWTQVSGDTLGWLCHPPGRVTDKPLHPMHVLLLSGFGGITERWNEPADQWLLNYHSALLETESAVGQCEWDENYRYVCELQGMEPIIDCKEYTSFAFEANGNFTSYHRETAAILMYAHDHCFDYIEPWPGCPQYTWYRIIGCPDFTSWVETVANQWLRAITDSQAAE